MKDVIHTESLLNPQVEQGKPRQCFIYAFVAFHQTLILFYANAQLDYWL